LSLYYTTTFSQTNTTKKGKPAELLINSKGGLFLFFLFFSFLDPERTLKFYAMNAGLWERKRGVGGCVCVDGTRLLPGKKNTQPAA
jgi:hypothetical protein